MKADDIPDLALVQLVSECADGICDYPMTAGYHGGRPGYGYVAGAGNPHWAYTSELQAKLPQFPPKVVLAKLRALNKRGLLDGCTCGCRGDWEMTEAGREFLAAAALEASE